jgi:hypothetical protein
MAIATATVTPDEMTGVQFGDKHHSARSIAPTGRAIQRARTVAS